MTAGSGPRAPATLGIDLGTSGVKVLAADAVTGRRLADATRPYPTSRRPDGRAEQNTTDWWRATVAATREVARGIAGREVAAVGLSGQMHGLVMADAGGRAIGPCRTWADLRPASEAAEISARVGMRAAVALSGSRPDAAFMASKALWAGRHEPAALRAARWLLLPKDWLRLALTGVAATEPSDASGSGLLDVRRREWSPLLCAAAEVDPALLPPIVASTAVAGTITERVADELGIPAGVPVVAGAGDAPAAAVGAGLWTADGRYALASLGTAGQIYVPLSAATVEPDGRLHTLCHPVADGWALMAAILSAGAALQWLADVLIRPGASPRSLLAAARRTPPGAAGLLFAPWLAGERSPYLDADIRAAFVGLGLHHTRGHLARAVVEGVAFALRAGLERMVALGVEAATVRLAGGVARDPLWRQVLADALGRRIEALPSVHASALGAARLAAAGAGLDAAGWRVRAANASDPDPAARDRYESTYHRYTRLYRSLRDL